MDRNQGVRPDLQAAEQGDLAGFYDTRLTCQIVAALTAYGQLARRFGVVGELIVVAGVSAVGLPVSLTTGPGRFEAENATVVTAPVQTRLSIDADQLMTPTGVLEAAAPLLDDLMTAFGWPRCVQLERDGTIVLKTWGRGWVPQIEEWVITNGLATRPDPVR